MLDIEFYHIDDIGHQLKMGKQHILKQNMPMIQGIYQMVLTTTDDVAIQRMSIGESHKSIAMLDERSDEQSLQRMREYVATVCTEAGVIVRTDVQKLKRP